MHGATLLRAVYGPRVHTNFLDPQEKDSGFTFMKNESMYMLHHIILTSVQENAKDTWYKFKVQCLVHKGRKSFSHTVIDFKLHKLSILA